MKIPFDLKFCKLEAPKWNRTNLRALAQQLFEQQGNPRFSIENRIIIAFDKSTTSSTFFLRCNEGIMLIKVMDMIRNPEKYWYKIYVNGKEILACVILIKENEYIKMSEIYEHPIGDGLREERKAVFAHRFLKHISWLTEGRIEPYSNPKEHGIDGYIDLS